MSILRVQAFGLCVTHVLVTLIHLLAHMLSNRLNVNTLNKRTVEIKITVRIYFNFYAVPVVIIQHETDRQAYSKSKPTETLQSTPTHPNTTMLTILFITLCSRAWF